MSVASLSVRTRIKEIEIYDADESEDGRLGHVDARYWLEDGDQLLGVADVRVYFKRKDVSLEALSSAALARGRELFSQIAQTYESDSPATLPEQLW